MRRSILCFVLLLSSLLINAQSENPSFFNKDKTLEKKLLDAIENRYKADLAGLTGKNKKEVAAIYKDRYETIQASINNSEIISDPKVAGYLNALVNEVVRKNPNLNSNELRVLFSRAWWPNASSMGEGTILFNIGMFQRLQNESQAVFIICHELSHFYLNHGNIQISKYVDTMSSETVQKQLKTINRSEYNRNKQLESLAKGIAFKSRRHSREFEHAADSMAVELMRNTDYNINEALTCLALLDSVDKDKYDTPLQLSRRFNFTLFPFKKSWLQSNVLTFTSSKDETADKESDSLKTHPDCALRIRQIAGLAKKYDKANSRNFIVDEKQFNELVKKFDYEVLAYTYESGAVSRSLYYALEMAEAFPDDDFVHAQIGKCLNSLYTHQKNHELGKITSLPGKQYEKEYNNLLEFIQNVRLSDIASLSYYYLQQFQDRFRNSAAFMAAWQESQTNFHSN